MTMAETVFPASMRAIPTSSEIVGARRVTGSQWTTVRRVQTQWPSENRFSVAVRALVDTTEVDPTTQGELRFVATDVNGVTGVGAPVTIGGPGWVETKWLEVKGQGVPVARVSIDVQMRITSGTGGLTAERVEPLFVSLPGSNVQPVLPLSIVDYSTQWGTFPAAVANPIQGSGNSLLFIAVAPGPGFDSLHNGGALQWVDPPGADVIADFEVAPDSSAQFVQRVRMWHMFSESGAATYTFGFDCAQTSGSTPATDTQSLAIIGFDGQASTIRVAGPNVDVSDPMPYPAVSSAVDDLILAVATSQNDDRMTGSPTGSSGVGAWTEEFDLSATGANVRRLLGVWSARSQSSAVDPGEHDFTGTVAAHAMFTVIVPTGSGGSPVTYSPVAPSLLSYDIRPADVSTWGANRGNLQLINAGPGWNPGQTGVGFTSSWGTGYDLTWNGAGDEISSWAMDDGESRRLWRTTPFPHRQAGLTTRFRLPLAQA